MPGVADPARCGQLPFEVRRPGPADRVRCPRCGAEAGSNIRIDDTSDERRYTEQERRRRRNLEVATSLTTVVLTLGDLDTTPALTAAAGRPPTHPTLADISHATLPADHPTMEAGASTGRQRYRSWSLAVEVPG